MTIDPHVPGAKLDQGKQRPALIYEGFCRALSAVADIGTFGAKKYTDNGWVSVENGHDRYTNAMHRHLLAEARGEKVDSDSGLLHSAHAAWNALARLELELRANEALALEQRQIGGDSPKGDGSGSK